MGCASSSPVLNGEGANAAEGSMGETKGATNNVIEGGEQVLNGKFEISTPC